MKKYLILIIIFSLCISIGVFAQEPILAYYDDTSGYFSIIYADGTEKNADVLFFGDTIPVGSTIITENGDFAEVELANGSIIRINENTTFRIDSIQGVNGATENAFYMAYGKFRAVAGQTTGSDQYTFKTKSAVCGVRGTDTGMESLWNDVMGEGISTKVFAFEGTVEIAKLDPISGEVMETIILEANQWVDTAADTFLPQIMSTAQLGNFMQGLEFKQLNPENVPGHGTTVSEADISEIGPEIPTDVIPEEVPEEGALDWLTELLGMEIGAVTIGDVTYAKAVLTPTIKIDKLKLVLYLPIFYQSNMFDPDDWYKPEGNNEWSFGFDAQYQDDIAGRIKDIVTDLLLKIKSLEWAKHGDAFFLKLGNLNNFSIGHGLIMRDYANDSDFPSIRRVGFNLGLDLDVFGFELMSDDLTKVFSLDPQIVGTRLYFRPFSSSFPFAIGASAVIDMDPAGDASGVGDPMFFNFGIDLEFPIEKSEDFSLILFSDVGFMLPYFREDVPATSISQGFAFDAIWYGNTGQESLRNYGIVAGVMGNISAFDWRLEGRYYTGTFRAPFFDALYDRKRLDYANEVISYLDNPGAAANTVSTLGIYGEGKYTIDEVFSFTLGYLWPWNITEDGLVMGDDDFFQLKFAIEPDVIPLVGIYGSISYERSRLIPIFKGETGAHLFDENTVLKTTIGYPFTKNVHVLFLLTTALKRDPNTGEVITSGGDPVIATTFSFETVIKF